MTPSAFVPIFEIGLSMFVIFVTAIVAAGAIGAFFFGRRQ